MVIAVEMELGREAKRGGTGTVMIMPRNSAHTLHSVYRDMKASITSFLVSMQSQCNQNLLHSSIATMQPPPMTVLSSACAGAR